ncbi:DUF5065 family protein [Bacillus toyonensis]|uniref:DUF5065 family protein n=1 Tax=Bacillus toyonensis TaxID=155322 RepID=UPI000B44F06B|nr:DUF5065 family protein [Bacillus toyonensis]MDT3498676.1 DUF5065 family protein [Bacillus toyonensis]MED3202229.1 DUF5065 family protein [Bacillus toyonensis]OTX09273.1 DUF5065 domain-containing protein [Bacillus thuringiensis serovar seoulensis]
MKKFSALVLTGALAVGGLTAVEMIKPTNQVAAASDWGFPDYRVIHHNAEYMPELAVGNLRQGQTFSATIRKNYIDSGLLRIYRIGYNNELYLIKQVNDSNSSKGIGTFTAPINSTYAPGTYTTLLKVGNNYYHGGTFEIRL